LRAAVDYAICGAFPLPVNDIRLVISAGTGKPSLAGFHMRSLKIREWFLVERNIWILKCLIDLNNGCEEPHFCYVLDKQLFISKDLFKHYFEWVFLLICCGLSLKRNCLQELIGY
jgi:hypothetical protein